MASREKSYRLEKRDSSHELGMTKRGCEIGWSFIHLAAIGLPADPNTVKSLQDVIDNEDTKKFGKVNRISPRQELMIFQILTETIYVIKFLIKIKWK